MKKILFIHHGGIEGGAPLSLLYTAQGLQREGFDITVALVNPSSQLHDLYMNEGFQTVETPWIPLVIKWSGGENPIYHPQVFVSIIKSALVWGESQKTLLGLIEELAIDIVHLNSSVLSNSAQILIKKDIPFIWHVREQGPQIKDFRFRFIQRLMLKSKFIIFLSDAERNSWLEGNKKVVSIVHNFVDFDFFDRNKFNPEKIKEELEIPEGVKVLLYTGGIKYHKGVFLLLETLSILKNKKVRFICLMPDSLIDKSKLSFTQKLKNLTGKLFLNKNIIEIEFLKKIKELNLIENCIVSSFTPDIRRFFSVSDVLLFPAIKPHFARPVVEAQAMGIPVVASSFPVMEELIIDNKTGLLAEIDPNNFADKIQRILSDEELAESFGARGILFATEKFNSTVQMQKIIAIYNKIVV